MRPAVDQRSPLRGLAESIGLNAGFAIGLMIAWSVFGEVASAAGVQPESSGQGAVGNPQGDDTEDPDNNDLTRPQGGFDVRFRYQSSSGATSRTDQEITMLRFTNRFTLDPDWKLAAIAQLPIVTKTSTDTDRETGTGDVFFQAALICSLDQDWAVGFGARLVAPAAEDNSGSGKWQIMPGFGVRYSLPALGPDSYFVPAIRYAVSFAGDPSRRNISQAQIAPTLNIVCLTACT
jgi:hypothetical protein